MQRVRHGLKSNTALGFASSFDHIPCAIFSHSTRGSVLKYTYATRGTTCRDTSMSSHYDEQGMFDC